MKKRIGCLHAHYSNIEYIEKALSPYEVELIHFVDPALMYRVTFDDNFDLSDAEKKVKEQIEWIAHCKVDGILITCTNYIAILQEDQLSIPVPIIKIDEPFFSFICSEDKSHLILFTNPATVDGTMKRLNNFALNLGKSIEFEVHVIENTFELIMQGQKEKYIDEVSKYIKKVINQEQVISVAQLSMVETAQLVEKQTNIKIVNPLDTLISYIESKFDLVKTPI
jgi:aspartate/glutamate racemase